MAASIVGEYSMGMCAAWRAFHASTSFTESSMICGPSARRAATSCSAALRRRSSILRLLKPMPDLTLGRGNRSMPLHFGHVLAVFDYDLVGFGGVVSSRHFSGLYCRDILVWLGKGSDVAPRDATFLIAVNRQILKDIPRPPNSASRDD